MDYAFHIHEFGDCSSSAGAIIWGSELSQGRYRLFADSLGNIVNA